jgi:predicted permease
VLRDRDPFLVSTRDVLAWRESAPVLIGEQLWRSLLGGDPRLEGRAVLLDGRRHPVAGVLPPGFDLPFGAQVWLPLRLDPAGGSGSRELSAVARLAPGASVSDAEREVRALAHRLELAHPETHNGWSAAVVGLRNQLIGDFDGRLRPTVRVLLLTVSALLLLAAANAIYLLAARAARRRKELAVRRALGADDWRLLRQLGFETLLPVLAAALLGIGIARLAVARLAEWSPLRGLALESARTLRVDAGSSVAILLLALALGVTLTLLAAFGAGALRAGRRRRPPVSRSAMRRLIAAEVTLSVLLLTVAGWLFSSLAQLAALELGFDPRQVTIARLDLSAGAPDAADRARRVDELVARLAALPGVTAAGVTTNAPLDPMSSDARVWAEAPTVPQQREAVLLVADRAVTAGYLEALGVRLAEGRLLESRDAAGAEPVAVISRDLGERLWPGRSALGRRLRRGGPDSEEPWRTVVGVIEPVKEDRGAFRRDRPAWYVPYAQHVPDRPLTLLVRAPGANSATVAGLRSAIAEAEPELPIYDAGALRDQVLELLAGERVAGLLVGLFALAALILQGGGTLAMVWNAAAWQRRELGVRLALGATRRRLLLEACGWPLKATAAGLVAGSLAALAAGRGLAALLSEVRLLDPRVLVAVAAITLAVALAAAWLPARAAQREDPISSLRAE